MKKLIVILSVLLILITAPTNAGTPVSNLTHFGKKAPVPSAVLASFNTITGMVIQYWFGSSATYDASNITWQRINSFWVASGNVLVVGGGGTGINISKATFRQNGQAVDFVYTPIF